MTRRDAAWAAGIAAALVTRYASESLRHRRERGHGYHLGDGDGDGERVEVGSRRFLRAAEAITAAPIADGNTIEAYINGDEIFPAYLDTILSAEESVSLVTYAFWRGDICYDVCDALCDRAKAGVRVDVLVDAMGAVQMERDVAERLERSGARLARFRPPKPYAVRRLNNRTHRKLLIADGRVGMTGGVGIAEEWTGNAQDPDHWRDTHVRVEGPVVRSMHGAFAENWLEATGEVVVSASHLPPLEPLEGGVPMQLVRSSAGVGDTNVEALYFLAIASARRTLDLTAAYFAPRPAFVEALCEAADRGVEVRLLVPGAHIDKNFVRVAGRAAYDHLIEGGVRIWEYGPTMLHAKTLVVDGAWSSVGSVNFDNRSFQLHDEATLCVQDEALAVRLTEQLERDLEVSEEIQPGRWQRRPARARLAERALQLARREL